jgi:probable phosphomutase (TIGR03848 family)
MGGRGGQVAPERHTEERLGEARYGAWTGRPLKELSKSPLWRAVQDRPSTVTFPRHEQYETESLAQMQRRALAAVDDWHTRIAAEHGPDAVWVAVSHGDVIKAVLADALGTPLDRFQRIVIDPGSVSIVQQTTRHPVVLRVNDTGTDPVVLPVPRAAGSGEDGDAAVGGGAGSV